MACVCCNLIGLCSCPNGQSYPVPSEILAVVTMSSGCSPYHEAMAGTYVLPYVPEGYAPGIYAYVAQDASEGFSAGILLRCTSTSGAGTFGIERCIPEIEFGTTSYQMAELNDVFEGRITLCDLQQSGSIQRTISIGQTLKSSGCVSTLINETIYCLGTVTISIP